MRVLLVICTLLVAVYAKPQYNYGTSISGTTDNFSVTEKCCSPQQSANNYNVNNQQDFSHRTSGNGINIGGGGDARQIGFSTDSSSQGISQSVNQFSAGGSSFSSNQNIQANQNQNRQFEESQSFGAPSVHKQYFVFAAPEEKESIQQTKRLRIGKPQTNYRIIFIKAPSSSSAELKLSAEYAPKEEKTIIYVLTKKDSELNVNEIATPAPITPSKPEVHFIKYKTDQEAELAQVQIQSEYDKIQGTSENINAGVAQERSFIGIAEASKTNLNQFSTTAIDESSNSRGTTGFNIGSAGNSGLTTNANNVYLPPAGERDYPGKAYSL